MRALVPEESANNFGPSAARGKFRHYRETRFFECNRRDLCLNSYGKKKLWNTRARARVYFNERMVEREAKEIKLNARQI